MRIFGVIPARMGSSRFPGKPLAPLMAMPVVCHVFHRSRMFGEFERLVVATCDREIEDAAINCGAESVTTSDRHERATDRVAEAIEVLGLRPAPDDLIVMVQGDEVFVSPEMIGNVVAAYKPTDNVAVVNLASRLSRPEDFADANTVKVAIAPDGRALYFSRSPIPSQSRESGAPIYQQTGLMAFPAKFLSEFAKLPSTPLEQIESVDLLRLLENGHRVQMVKTEIETIGIDTPEDLARAETMMRHDPLVSEYIT